MSRMTLALKLAMTALLCTSAMTATVALGQGMPKAYSFGDEGGGSGGGGAYRSFILSMPVATMGSDMVGHMEFNLAGKASLAIEVMGSGRHEDVDEKTKKDTGESMMTDARGASFLVSRYTQPMRMAGFYWGLGVGYRQQHVQWHTKPDDKSYGYGLNESDMLDHDAQLTGTTGHARVGYRYVGQDVPLLAGLYIGVRHFQAGVKDVKHKDDDNGEQSVNYTPMTDEDRDALLHRYQTSPEVGVEVGFSF